MILTLSPTPLLRAFHAPEVVVDCGLPADAEGTACAAYLMWQVEYSGYTARLSIPRQAEAERALNHALFRGRAA